MELNLDFLPLDEWDQIFRFQAKLTRQTRKYLYRAVKLQQRKRILEVGCGTGTIIEELLKTTSVEIYGTESKSIFYEFCKQKFSNKRVKIFKSHASRMPFERNFFDLIVLHFSYIWFKDREKAFKEIRRITAKNGNMIFCAEPDYGMIFEYPEKIFSQELVKYVKKFNGNIKAGRSIIEFAKFKNIEKLQYGLMDYKAHQSQEKEMELNYKVLRHFTNDTELREKYNKVKRLIKDYNYLLYLPVFYGNFIKS